MTAIEFHTQTKTAKTNIFPGTHALIFVIDSCDRTRMEEAKSELSRIIQDREMRNVVLLVFANKQDVDGGKLITPFSEEKLKPTNPSSQQCDQTT
jgi:signal recognition particle receptor subunit beta